MNQPFFFRGYNKTEENKQNSLAWGTGKLKQSTWILSFFRHKKTEVEK